MKDLILIGGGGHCKSCIEVIEKLEQYNIIGILDKYEKIGNCLFGYDFIGTDNDIEKYSLGKVSFCLTVGQVTAKSEIRVALYKSLIKNSADLPVIISKDSIVSRYSKIDFGTIILSGAIINSAVTIGKNCIVNSNALIEHDVEIGDHCHISTGAIINGECSIGKNCMVSTGAILKNGISIPDNTMIGMGAVVTKNIKISGIYFGNPARMIEK